MFKIGQKVFIKLESKDYFGKYAGTNARISHIYYGHDTLDVEVYDGHVYVCPVDYIDLIEEQELPPEIPKNINCSHTNKYYNVLSRTLQFWVCPDCGKEV